MAFLFHAAKSARHHAPQRSWSTMAKGPVLLTGGSGFIAAHILRLFLQRGYPVRITVRSKAKGEEVLAGYPNANSQLEYVVVPDVSEPNAFDDAVKTSPPLAGVIHTATPLHFNNKHPDELMVPALQGTLGLLYSVHQYAPSVRRVVVLSSFASILDPYKGYWPGKIYTEKDWSPVTWETATGSLNINNYSGAKKFAEKAAWEICEKEKPNFDLVTLCPGLVFGPIINKQSLSSLNLSSQIVCGYLLGAVKEVTPNPSLPWADVRDVAEAHVRAYETPEAGGKRILVAADGIYSNQEIVDILRKNFPKRKGVIPEGIPGSGLGLKAGEYYLTDNSLSKELLGLNYVPLEKSITDLAKSLLALAEGMAGLTSISSKL